MKNANKSIRILLLYPFDLLFPAGVEQIFKLDLFFAFFPFVLVFITSFLTPGSSTLVEFHGTLQNYQDLFNSLYIRVFVRSFYIAGLTALFCLILASEFTNQCNQGYATGGIDAT